MKQVKGTPVQATSLDTNMWVIEHRVPRVGEYVMLPGPIYTWIVFDTDPLRKTECACVVGMLVRDSDDPTRFTIRRLEMVPADTSVDPAVLHRRLFHK